jgi:N-acyl-D-amino-acid deacylase
MFSLFGLLAFLGVELDLAYCQTSSEDVKGYPSSLKRALDLGFDRLSKGVDNYPKHRDCFSCHHQAVPLLSYRLNSKPDRSDRVIWGDQTDRVNRLVEFSKKSLSKELAELKSHEEIGGRGMTLGYALWTMAMSQSDWGELADQLVEKAIATQQADGHWRIHSVRPPAASSELMATTLVLLGLSYYLDSREQTSTPVVSRAAIEQACNRALLWKANQPEPTDTEDLCASVWFDYLTEHLGHGPLATGYTGLGGPPGLVLAVRGSQKERSVDENSSEPSKRPFDDSQLQSLRRYYSYSERAKRQVLLRGMQNQDGGWGSQPGRESDAYSTATALLILSQIDQDYKFSGFYHKAWFRKGAKYLIGTQKPDGSWHVSSRANPVQEFFDNGDPHDTDQFISMQATAWSLAALSSAYHRHRWPLNVDTPKLITTK